ncbi:hypothetical protein ORN01_25080 [Bacillus cereus]|uniref:hypothetical protein n=1 Tax=Bacillus cereus TaxID=1396 RepID=UPI002ABED585|nr:hypothetical protein [Bacillus cereus]MDZ4632232.1 hypothetical protein [Bacillus cereus]
MNKREKLIKKCFNRIGMTVFEKEGMKKGTITSFKLEDNPDGTYSVIFMVMFDLNNGFVRIDHFHESQLVLMKGTEI